MADRTAVLLLAHGTPDSLDEIPEYLSNITGGRALPQSVVEEIRHRYSLIGRSPLTDLTLEQGRLLAEQLGLPVYVGMRNWKPYIRDVVCRMRNDGIEQAAAICLAPQNSRTSVGLYRKALLAATDGMEIEFVEGWADHPLLADAFAERLRTVYEPFRAEAGTPLPVLFTAHSVPCRTIQTAPQTQESPTPPSGTGPDPYAVEARRTAASVAGRVGIAEQHWYFAFQSQGMSGGPWIGPTVEDTLTALRKEGVRHLVIQPIGFLCDHVEILYDIDIGFQELAGNLGLELRRPESLNASPLLIAALADLSRKALARLEAQ
jgi:protoporphyrin/coproporphyrin ferrochelatase